MASIKMVNACTLQWKYKPHFSCLRIQCWDYTKCNTETDDTAARGHKTYTCATENPELGLFQTGKQNESQNTSRNIYDPFFIFILFVCWKCWCTKYAQIIVVNRSVVTSHCQSSVLINSHAKADRLNYQMLHCCLNHKPLSCKKSVGILEPEVN